MDTNAAMTLSNQIRETAYAIHQYHGTGYLEKVYENALAHRLRKAGLDVEQQHPLTVRDEDGAAIGEYCADLLVEGSLVVELKACKTTKDEHSAQLLNYSKGTGLEHGMLINFGSYKFFIKKFAKRAETTTAPKLNSLLPPLFAFFAFFRG